MEIKVGQKWKAKKDVMCNGATLFCKEGDNIEILRIELNSFFIIGPYGFNLCVLSDYIYEYFELFSETKNYDYINPSHYKGFSKEVIDMMVDIWGKENVATHCEITAFKYKMRLGTKPDQPIERDLEKANWYLNKAKELKL